MSKEKQDTIQTSDKLLTEKEREACQRIAALPEGLKSQRAATLLAIDDGSTQAAASAQTGLTRGQIKYLLTIFRQKRLAIFPDDVQGVEKMQVEIKKKKKDKKTKKDKAKKSKTEREKKKAKKEKKGKKSKKGKAKANKKKSKKQKR